MGNVDRFDWIEQLVASGTPIPPDTASSNLIGRVVSAAVAKGANRPALLEAIGTSEAAIRNQLSRVSGQVLIRLFSSLEHHLSDPAIAMRVGKSSKPHCFSDIGFATRLLPNLYEVLDANIKMQILRQTLYAVKLVQDSDSVRLEWDIGRYDAQEIAAVVEFSVGTYVRLAREIWGAELIIDNISFKHVARLEPQIYQDMLGVAVTCGASRNSISFSAEQAKAPSPCANALLLNAATVCHSAPVEWMREGKRHSAFTYFYLWTELNKSPATLDRAARSFGMAERTLRRHLVEEGHPFRTLLDEVRKSMCSLYRLESKRSLSDIAELLGYGELSAFSRAYRRWFGEPPSRSWSTKMGSQP
jgi:AraC-like DNA-binding protein